MVDPAEGHEQRPISYTPPVPDGPDRPWTRDRQTRWWLVVPADLIGSALASVLGVAAAHPGAGAEALRVGDVVPGLIWVVTAWMIVHARYRDDHLETLVPDGLHVIGAACLMEVLQRALTTGGAGLGVSLGSWALMTVCLKLVLLGGWRVLYGYAKAHDSLVPRGIQRRLDAQEAATAEQGPAGSDDEHPGAEDGQ